MGENLMIVGIYASLDEETMVIFRFYFIVLKLFSSMTIHTFRLQ